LLKMNPSHLIAPLAVAGTLIGTMLVGAPNAGAEPWKPCGGVAPDSFFSSTSQSTQTCKNSGGANWELYSGSPAPVVQTCDEADDTQCGGNADSFGTPDTGPARIGFPKIRNFIGGLVVGYDAPAPKRHRFGGL
jgi:hypothetical protein